MTALAPDRANQDLRPAPCALPREAAEAMATGDFAAAVKAFNTVLIRDPTDVDALCGLGDALKATRDLEGAARAYRRALARDTCSVAAFAGLADIDRQQGLFDQALDHCEKAVVHSGAAPRAALFVLGGRILCELGRHDHALSALTNALALDPDNPDAYVAIGLLFEAQERPLDAFAAYQKALEFRPRDVLAYNNMAGLLVVQGQLDLAVATARVAVSLAPDHPDVYLNLATALRLRGDADEALTTYKRIIALDPDHGEALVELCHRRQHACDWNGLDQQLEHARAQSYRKGRLVSPFAIMTSTGSPAEQLACARVWGKRLTSGAPALAAYAPRPAHKRGSKLKLGYLSADFHSHATAMLMVDMLELHDRDRFEVFGYSLGPDDGSIMRRRLVAAFDTFVDLRTIGDSEAARRIHADGIDILLDLKGYTQNARVKILAHRPAPIQVNYLGFPGTMGAPFIDYIIADTHVAPLDHAADFDEKIVHLPACYQPNDRRRTFPTRYPSRAASGLPDDGFIFCSFNNPYKITPEVFDVWMGLLRETPGSVLWILEPSGRAAENLRREAARRGIAADRLVFAPFVEADAHLARLGVADLFLDTLPVNAHTTASEALWVGLPVVTCVGDAFAGRVAASLLHAVGMADLITHDLAEYRAKALALAHDPDALEQVRNRLRSARLTAPLFDTPRYTRQYEAALTQMAAYRDAGLLPTAFGVSAGIA